MSIFDKKVVPHAPRSLKEIETSEYTGNYSTSSSYPPTSTFVSFAPNSGKMTTHYKNNREEVNLSLEAILGIKPEDYSVSSPSFSSRVNHSQHDTLEELLSRIHGSIPKIDIQEKEKEKDLPTEESFDLVPEIPKKKTTPEPKKQKITRKKHSRQIPKEIEPPVVEDNDESNKIEKEVAI